MQDDRPTYSTLKDSKGGPARYPWATRVSSLPVTSETLSEEVIRKCPTVQQVTSFLHATQDTPVDADDGKRFLVGWVVVQLPPRKLLRKKWDQGSPTERPSSGENEAAWRSNGKGASSPGPLPVTSMNLHKASAGLKSPV